MFYQDSIEGRLRFGDVLKGYVSTAPNLAKPLGEKAKEPYRIDVSVPDFSVVIDPCCEIGGGTLSLTPLIHVKATLWDTPSLLKDITRINRKGMPKDLMHPQQWNELPDSRKTTAMNSVPDYGHRTCFVYEGNSQFDEYAVARPAKYEEVVDPASDLSKYNQIHEQITFMTRYYMINFKNIFHVNCDKVSDPQKIIDDSILGSKVLQLSIKTRNELREKMADYFGTPPAEDIVDV
jgi:hypothetical protein